MSFDVQDFLPERVQSARAYVPGKQINTTDWLKINTNEFPYAPSPKVAEAVTKACKDLRLYPEPTGEALRMALAKKHEVKPEQILLGNGCDDILNIALRTYSDTGDIIAYLNPSYSLYPVLIHNHAARGLPIEYLPDFEFPLEAATGADYRMLFLTSPNAPSGVGISNVSIRQVLSQKRAMTVIDETYSDFAEETTVPLIAEYPHLIIAKSFSKTYGLAGLRVGYAIGHASVIAEMHKIRDVYNVNRLSQAGALAALQDTEYYGTKQAEIMRAREDFQIFLQNVLRWKTLPSQTNFLFTYPQRPGDSEPTGNLAKELYNFLVEKKILVRYFSSHPSIESGIRISIAQPDEMEFLKSQLLAWTRNV